jgi:hypothetical protein
MFFSTVTEYRPSWEDSPPRKFYDPHRLYNTDGYTLQPNESRLLIITGNAPCTDDKYIYKLNINEVSPQSNVSTFQITMPSSEQLCLVITNTSACSNIHVDQFIPLSSVLKMPHIQSQLCHMAASELALLYNRMGHNHVLPAFKWPKNDDDITQNEIEIIDTD